MSVKSRFLALRTDGDQPPLFWVGGSLGAYRIMQELGPRHPFYCLRSHSAHERLRQTTLIQLAEYHVQTIESVLPQGPCCLMGLCVRSLLSLEIAQQLTRRGRDVRLLVLLNPPLLYEATADSRTQTALRRVMARAKYHSIGLRTGGSRYALKALQSFAKRSGGKVWRELCLILSDRGLSLPDFIQKVENVEMQEFLQMRTCAKHYSIQRYPRPTLIASSEVEFYKQPSDSRRLLAQLIGSHAVTASVPGGEGTMLSPDNSRLIASLIRTTLGQSQESLTLALVTTGSYGS